ncbi:MAG: NAD(P)-dependent oxidoreductase [Dehalococcoidales bacterium]
MATDANAKVAVTGPYGRLGSELVRRGCIPVDAIITDMDVLNNQLSEIDPDVVVHCAALTKVDECEMMPDHAARINAGGPFNLCSRFKGKIVYISTDYIFDGRHGPYSENDRPNPISVYGWSKLGGEIVLKNRGNSDDLTVRTTMLFDAHSRNFVTVIASLLRCGGRLSLPNLLIGSPTYIPRLVDGLLEAIKQDVSGTVNLAGWRVMSRWEFGQYIADALGTDRQKVVATEDVGGRAPRPLNAGLRIDRARSLGLPIGDPLDGLEEVINCLGESGSWATQLRSTA